MSQRPQLDEVKKMNYDNTDVSWKDSQFQFDFANFQLIY